LQKDKAREFYVRGCDAGEVLSCYNWGFVELAGDSPEKAVGPFQKACSRRFGQGCHSLANVYEEAGDFDIAAKFYASACKLGHLPGCTRADRLAYAQATRPFLNLAQSRGPAYLAIVLLLSFVLGKISLDYSRRNILHRQEDLKRKTA
jgi:TPR repeat protein